MPLTPEGYRPRLLEDKLARYLEAFGAVEVRGPKWCGKTWLSLSRAESVAHLDDETVRQAVDVNHRLALAGARPRLIDEWQEVPELWDAVRREVDASGSAPGSFILTGSSRPRGKDKVHHSGAGRIARLNMRPLSLFESGLSDGSVSLESLFAGEDLEGRPASTNLDELARSICTGGWPGSLGRSEQAARLISSQYIDALCDTTEDTASGRIDPVELRRVLVALARNDATTASSATLALDASLDEGDASPAGQRLGKYLSYLEQSYLLCTLHGWDAPVRARARVRTKPKRYLVDPSLSAALLGYDPDRLQWDAQMFGILFESLCLRDIAVYLEASTKLPSPTLWYYRDSYGLEVDAVVELADGRWAAFEVKLSSAKADKAATSLLRLRDKVLANPAARNREPAFLAILVGDSPFVYTRDDGVLVVPITYLGR